MNSEEKLPLTSMDIKEDQLNKLKSIFPEVFTEGNQVDWDKLRLTLGETIDTGKERYGMSWPGKADCFKTIQQPSVATLVPDRTESVDFDTTQNLFIEGDNLEVLKLLQKSYLGKVKMIYIDPPYNTGNDFIYPDNYSENLQTYLEYTGQTDAEGRKFATNTETDGRFHSKWMNMMYPRLFLAKNLLKEDGVIFISIDDHEVNNLRILCDEIFGEENFVACLIWEKGRKNDAKFFSVGHEYLLVYAKSQQTLREKKIIWREEKPGARDIWDQYIKLRQKWGKNDSAIEQDLAAWYTSLPKSHSAKKWSRYKRIDANGPWRDRDISWPGGGGPRYDIPHPITGIPCTVPEAGWRYSKFEEMQRQIKLGLVEFREDHTNPPFRKAHIRPILEELEIEGDDEPDEEDEGFATQVRGSYFYKQSQVAVKYLRSLLGGKVFNNPKDHKELAKLFNYVTSSDTSGIVIDFFAGSGSTAEAIFDVNQEFDKNLKFICIQIPEPIDEKKEPFKLGYKTIADIGKERIRRVIQKIKKEQTEKQRKEQESLFTDKTATAPLDLGFKVFKLQKSNFNVWDANVEKRPEAIQTQLFNHIDHIAPEAAQEAILYELLFKSGFELTTPIAKLELEGKTVFSVADGELLVCLEKQLTHALIKAMAEQSPARVICLDEGFQNNDQLKTNAVQIMKSKGVLNFRTV